MRPQLPGAQVQGAVDAVEQERVGVDWSWVTAMPGSVLARASAPAMACADSPRSGLRIVSSSPESSAAAVTRRAIDFIHRGGWPVASGCHRAPSQVSQRCQAGT